MKKTLQTFLLIALIAGATSCSSKKADQEVAAPPAPGTTPTTPTGTGTTTTCGSSTTAGNSVCFSPVSFQELGYYVGTHPLNDPSNIQLTVQLSNSGGRYPGTITLSYQDNGQNFAGIFNANTGVNSNISGANGYNGYNKSEFNRWFVYEGRNVFTGFYQDEYGAVVLVIENTLDTGDGSGGGFLNGSVWYKNFAQSMAQYNDTERHCWFLSDGPYNCQSTTVMNKSTLYPSNGYRKLGTFTGLSRAAAFGTN